MNAIAPWMQTVSGRAVDLLAPLPDQIVLADIAHALARLPRFNAHTPTPWSVAAHSRLVAQLVGHYARTRELRLAGLLHDAHEAYMGDLIAPMKAALAHVDAGAAISWRLIETRLQCVIHQAFGLDPILPIAWRDAIRHADLQALEIERAAFMQPHPRPWMTLPVPPLGAGLPPHDDPAQETQAFIEGVEDLRHD